MGMAAQIPIVATTSTPGIARNSKKRPASPSHNGSSAGGYSASKKKKVSASGFAQVRCHSPNLRVRGSPHSLPLPIQGARGRMRGPEWVGLSEAGRFVWAGPYSHTSFVDAVYGASETSPHPLTLATWGLIK